MKKRGENWNFIIESIKGIYRILKTGGPHTNYFNDVETSKIDERYRKAFQKDTQTLFIFGFVKEELRGEDTSTGFIVPNYAPELGEISTFFELVAWDDLMFIINPKYNTLYVIAYTDTD